MRSASSVRNSAFSTPTSSARRRAAATISGAKSVIITRPVSPTMGAAINPVSPKPAASSRMLSPGCGSSLRTIHSLTGRDVFYSSSRSLYQPGAMASQATLLRWRAASGCAAISPGDVTFFLIRSGTKIGSRSSAGPQTGLRTENRGATISAQASGLRTGYVRRS
jgi:hypothetical protein